MKLSIWAFILIRTWVVVLLAYSATTTAADIRIIATRSTEIVLSEVGPVFETQTGHKLVLSVGLAAPQLRRIHSGESFDVAILTPAVIDSLIRDNRVFPESRTDILRVGTAIAVRKGTARPDISSVEALRTTLLNAKSIAYLRIGLSGIWLAGLMEHLGISAEVKAKTRLPELDVVGDLVANGEAELGITAASTLLATPGIEIVGPLPPEVQFYNVFTAGINSQTSSLEPARQLINFLKGPLAAAVIRAKGMEPG